MLNKLLPPLFAFLCIAFASRAGQPPPPSSWEKDIKAFEERDKANPPPKGEILFVGSSSIRLWNVEESFPELKVINRGFGGSMTSDAVRLADRIVIPYQSRIVVFYSGDNDIASGKPPQQVFEDAKAFVKIVHDKLPAARFVLIGIKPSILRWNLVEKMRETNRLVREFFKNDEKVVCVDVDAPMLGTDGKPRPELFRADGLHLNDEGYKLWAELVRPHLQPAPAPKVP